MLVSRTISPRFYETDGLGHISNVSIAGWLEVSRMGFVDSLEHVDDLSLNDWALASIKIDYLAETFFGADVELRTTHATVGNSSLTIDSEIWQRDQLTVRARAILVHFDTKLRSKKRIPDSLRAQIGTDSH